MTFLSFFYDSIIKYNILESKIEKYFCRGFKLENGGKILDNGKEISFSDKAKAVALDYATAKFGKKRLTGEEKEKVSKNSIIFEGLWKNQDLVQRDNKEQQKTESLIL